MLLCCVGVRMDCTNGRDMFRPPALYVRYMRTLYP
jgi:hypothetical protein